MNIIESDFIPDSKFEKHVAKKERELARAKKIELITKTETSKVLATYEIQKVKIDGILDNISEAFR